MSTRGVIARLTGVLPPQFRGRYNHWDSYPSGLGQTLWKLYYEQFDRDLNAMLRVLIDEHPAGWSTINGADFTLASGFTELPNPEETEAARPVCYCHGDRAEEAWEVTEKNAAGSGCEWAYAFAPGNHPEHDAMLILSSFRPSGQKMIGFFGQGDPQSVWAVVVVVALQGKEPDWDALDSASPLDPLFDAKGYERGAKSQTTVHRDKRPGIYIVREPNGASHYVSRDSEAGQPLFYCTCSPDEAAPSPVCLHAQALRHYLEEHHQAARERQSRGLLYTGSRADAGNATVIIWEGGQPTLLPIQTSQRLFHHSSGYAWGYEGSGPAQLALAILLDFTGDEELAVKSHQAFKREIIARIPQDEPSWEITAEQIELFLQASDFKT